MARDPHSQRSGKSFGRVLVDIFLDAAAAGVVAARFVGKLAGRQRNRPRGALENYSYDPKSNQYGRTRSQLAPSTDRSRRDRHERRSRSRSERQNEYNLPREQRGQDGSPTQTQQGSHRPPMRDLSVSQRGKQRAEHSSRTRAQTFPVASGALPADGSFPRERVQSDTTPNAARNADLQSRHRRRHSDPRVGARESSSRIDTRKGQNGRGESSSRVRRSRTSADNTSSRGQRREDRTQNWVLETPFSQVGSANKRRDSRRARDLSASGANSSVVDPALQHRSRSQPRESRNTPVMASPHRRLSMDRPRRRSEEPRISAETARRNASLGREPTQTQKTPRLPRAIFTNGLSHRAQKSRASPQTPSGVDTGTHTPSTPISPRDVSRSPRNTESRESQYRAMNPILAERHIRRSAETTPRPNPSDLSDPLIPSMPPRECVVCIELKPSSAFPVSKVTPACNHVPRACLSCLRRQIRMNMETRMWSDVRCPECSEKMEYLDVQRFADPDTFARYDQLSVQSALNAEPNVVHCIAGCGYAQYHASGSAQPIVNCGQCGARSCFTHGVRWHDGMTCEQYDRYLANPANFRPKMEMEEQESHGRRSRPETDHSSTGTDIYKMHPERSSGSSRRRKSRNDANQEAASHESARRTQNEELKRKEVALKQQKQDEEASLAKLQEISQPCPGCKRPIQKYDGCQHMTCSQCRHEFCWRCSAPWGGPHSSGCRGTLY